MGMAARPRNDATSIDVIVADGQVIRGRALERLLVACPRVHRVRVTLGAADLLVAARREQPDSVVIDPALSAPLGPLVHELLQLHPTPRLVLYPATADEPSCCERAVAVHASASADELVAAIVARCFTRGPARDVNPVLLTSREREVMLLARRGYTVDEIAAIACMSTGTAKTHLSHAYGKLDAHNRASAVAECIRRGILD